MGWFSRGAEERQRERETFLEAIRLITEGQQKQVDLMLAQLQGIQTYLNFLYANGEPTSRVMRDEDEWSMEVDRARQAARWQGEES
jgi:hypothetical protein